MEKSNKRFSEKNNMEQVTFYRCSGLRLNELRNIRGSDLYFDEFGSPWLSVTRGTKGGRKRHTKLYGSPEELELCVNLCLKAKDGKVFPHVNKCANITVTGRNTVREYMRLKNGISAPCPFLKKSTAGKTERYCL